MDELADRDTLEKLLRIDDLCTARGEFHYAIAVRRRQIRMFPDGRAGAQS